MYKLIAEQPFNLLRWFSVLSLATVVIASVVTSVFLSRFLSEHMLRRDAEVTMDFVQSVAKVQKAAEYFAGRRQSDKNWEEFFDHLDGLADVLRVNAYDKEYKIIGSTDKSLEGKKFQDNDELDDAFKGKLAIGGGITSKDKMPKAEHMHLSDAPIQYVENYVPIRDGAVGPVVGVVELYRTPRALYETIDKGKKYIWMGGIASGLFLYAMLFWLMRRATRTIAQQQERIVQAETMATIGELSGAVAHSIRNPLASIRSSAELIQDDQVGTLKETAGDIIAEVDRVEGWVRGLLLYARPLSEKIKKECLNSIIKEAMLGNVRELEKRGIIAATNLSNDLPTVEANAPLLLQVMNNLITNAIDAMPDGGRISVDSKLGPGPSVQVSVTDNGMGITREQFSSIFKPFHTNKPKGLGLGLALVKRIVERHGGKVDVDSLPGRGTTVLLSFPATI
jgi:two-component system, NtrC family, sensor histidine kinase HydH